MIATKNQVLFQVSQDLEIYQKPPESTIIPKFPGGGPLDPPFRGWASAHTMHYILIFAKLASYKLLLGSGIAVVNF